MQIFYYNQCNYEIWQATFYLSYGRFLVAIVILPNTCPKVTCREWKRLLLSMKHGGFDSISTSSGSHLPAPPGEAQWKLQNGPWKSSVGPDSPSPVLAMRHPCRPAARHRGWGPSAMPTSSPGHAEPGMCWNFNSVQRGETSFRRSVTPFRSTAAPPSSPSVLWLWALWSPQACSSLVLRGKSREDYKEPDWGRLMMVSPITKINKR